jgi:hypothetical protein
MQPADLAASYELGPGVDLDAELAFTWTEPDPERAPDFADLADYGAFEIGRIAIEF